MPLYYFDVTDAGNTVDDEFGTDLTGDAEARDQGIGLLPDIAREVMPDGDRHEIAVAVRNVRRQTVYEATLTLHGRWWPGRG